MKKTFDRKKILKEAGILLITTVMLLSTVVTANTEQSHDQPLMLDDYSMTIEDVTAHPGDEGVIIPVNGVWAEDIKAYIFRFTYDPEIIEIVEVNVDGCVGENGEVSEFYPPGTVHFQVAMDPPVQSGDGKLANVVVNIIGDEGETELIFVEEFCWYTDVNVVPHYPVLYDGTITIIPPQISIESISGGLFFVKVDLKNIGDEEATDVSWSITLDGGLIILGGETNGTVDIPAGETVTIRSSLIFGFGKPDITVSADNIEETVPATVLLFFILL